MKRFLILLAAIPLLLAAPAWAGKRVEVVTDLNDRFVIEEAADWQVMVEKELTLRFANVRVDSRRGYPFSLMLYFKADTPDLAQFDTPEKMARAVRTSSEKYLRRSVEKEVKLLNAPVKFGYGFFTVLTDADEIKKPVQAPGQYKYLTRGMVRLSRDSALGFSLMTNDLNSADYEKLLAYVYHFIKDGSAPNGVRPVGPTESRAAESAPIAVAASATASATAKEPARSSRSHLDARKCLSLTDSAKVAACAAQFR